MKPRGKSRTTDKSQLRAEKSSSQDFARTLEEVYYAFLKKSNTPTHPKPATTDGGSAAPPLQRRVPPSLPHQLTGHLQVGRSYTPSSGPGPNLRQQAPNAKTWWSDRAQLEGSLAPFVEGVGPAGRFFRTLIPPQKDSRLWGKFRDSVVEYGRRLGATPGLDFNNQRLQTAALMESMLLASPYAQGDMEELVRSAQNRLRHLNLASLQTNKDIEDNLITDLERRALEFAGAGGNRELQNQIRGAIRDFLNDNILHYRSTYLPAPINVSQYPDLTSLMPDENVVRGAAIRDAAETINQWLAANNRNLTVEDLQKFLSSQRARMASSPQARFTSGESHADEMAAEWEAQLQENIQKERELQQQLQQQYLQQQMQHYPQQPAVGPEQQNVGAASGSGAFNWGDVSDFHKALVMGGILLSLLGGMGGFGGSGQGAPLLLGLGTALYGLTGGDLSRAFSWDFWNGLFGGLSRTGQGGQAAPQTANLQQTQPAQAGRHGRSADFSGLVGRAGALLADGEFLSQASGLWNEFRNNPNDTVGLLSKYNHLKRQYPAFSSLVRDLVHLTQSNPEMAQTVLQNMPDNLRNVAELILQIEGRAG